MNNKEFFIIKVDGPKPIPVQVGTISKTSGQPDPGAVSATQELGEIAIPNFSNVWGKLKKDKAQKLTGEVEFLPWGHPDGELIQIRHLKNCSSISVEYQKEKKLTVPPEESEIVLKVGQNQFAIATNKNKIAVLEHHTYNRSNGSRDPDLKHTRFETYQAQPISEVNVSEIQERQRAENIVMDARINSANLDTLAKLFDLPTDQSDEVTFKKLIYFSQSPKDFFKVLGDHAKNYKATLVAAAEVTLISFEPEGNVMIIIGGQKDVLMTDVEGRDADECIEFITDHITTAMYYHALNRLQGELERYQQLVLS